MPEIHLVEIEPVDDIRDLFVILSRMVSKTVHFVSGVSGVGKTSVMRELKGLLPDTFEVHDFDEQGVPAGADHAWRRRRTRQWIEKGVDVLESKDGFVICGIANPEEIEEMRDLPDVDIRIILLDADDDIIEKRLRGRNENKAVRAGLERVTGDAERFIQDNRNFTPVIREICKKHDCPVIDTTNLAPREVAEEVMRIIKGEK